MSFDVDSVSQLFQSMDFETAASVASWTNFFLDIRSFFASKNEANEKATIDEYLESLRRRDQSELVDLILAHRERFEMLFSALETSLVGAIDRLDANMERRHQENFSYRVDPSRIVIKGDDCGWEPESQFSIKDEWQKSKLRNRFTIVNRNQTKLTLKEGSGTILHDSQQISISLKPGEYTIEAQGGSIPIVLSTKDSVLWKKGERYSNQELRLTFDQCNQEIRFAFDGTAFVPKEDQ